MVGATTVGIPTVGASGAGGERRELLLEGADNRSSFEVTVDGEIVADDPTDPDAVGRISGASVEGVIGDEACRYLVTGELRHLSVEGAATVRYDGKTVTGDS